MKEKIVEINQQSQAREKHFEIELKKKDLQSQVQKNELTSKLSLIENEISMSQIYTNEMEEMKDNEEKFRVKKDVLTSIRPMSPKSTRCKRSWTKPTIHLPTSEKLLIE